MNFSNIADQYQKACKEVKKAIQDSRFKPSWFQEQLGFSNSPSAFYKRLSQGNWTPEQLGHIGLLLEGKAVIKD
jgi:hypothetical protein